MSPSFALPIRSASLSLERCCCSFEPFAIRKEEARRESGSSILEEEDDEEGPSIERSQRQDYRAISVDHSVRGAKGRK